MMQLFAKNGLFLFKFLYYRKFHGNGIFLANGCTVEQNSRKKTLLKIKFYFQLIHTDLFKSLAIYQFGFVPIFKHSYLVTNNLLPNFLMAVIHSFFNIMSSLIPWDQNGGSGETDAQVKILI